MGMHFDKELVNPNIARTIRFTPILYDWLMKVKDREQLSFNQVVLQCCKNCMAEDNDRESAESKAREKSNGKEEMQDRDM